MPNDCRLGGEDGRLLIVTGPNMGGKSTYLRMVALVVLLAQTGSFVPATAARIGPIDRLFTRVGSADDLVAGASTFLVEMAETANILRHATPRSLVVLDEVGRGTSTHDGLCIAQAVLEHLHDAIGARTLFATHFHELTALADTHDGARNVTVAVDERDGEIAFLYRVVPGAADRSYGVQVARLAGLLARARGRRRPGHGTTLKSANEPRRANGHVGIRAWTVLEPSRSRHWICRRWSPPPKRPLPREGGGETRSAGFPLSAAAVRGARGRGPLLRVSEETAEYRLQSADGPIARAGSPRGGVLAELLALDLGNITPLRALNLLHDLQTTARSTLPWRSWLEELARSHQALPDGIAKPSEVERG